MHLFAGVGGGLLADRILGHDPIIAVEWDRYACQVLRERAADGWFPNLSVWEGDVRLFDPSEYANRVDCIHAGFPCQDISVAGNQAGLGEGTRSGLYREVLRIAGIVKPRQIFLENVSAILSNGLGTVLADLAAMGYDCRWICIRASDVGAPHHRDRWWCLARYTDSINVGEVAGVCEGAETFTYGSGANDTNADLQHGQRRSKSQQSDSDSGAAWIESQGLCGNVCNPEHARWNAAEVSGKDISNESQTPPWTQLCGNESTGASGSWKDSDVADTNDKRQLQQKRTFDNQWRRIGDSSEFESDEDVADPDCLRQSGQGKHERPKHSTPDSDRQTDRLIDSGEGNADWWDVESNVGRVANGIPNRVDKLKGLGNAQVPIQCATAWKLLGGE